MTKKKERTLIIVESPTKARTIAGFLGDDYEIDSSFGHVRDLPKSKLGIEIEKNFEPDYVIPRKAQKQVTALRKKAEKAEKIILATDEDREGEAIAYHLIEALKLRDRINEGEVKRIVFHEITKGAIEAALKNPRAVNMDLVNAQQARRVLDRLVGYKLSPFLWKKVMKGLSAGRVQSVAVRLINDREEEIKAFKPTAYYSITAKVEVETTKEEREILTVELFKINKKSLPKPGILEKEEVGKIVKDLKTAKYELYNIARKETQKQPSPPFTTSTLQQVAVNRLGYSAKKTMMLAQRLYEKGFITYMRTDSVSLSKESVLTAKKLIEEKYGQEYALLTPRRFTQKSKLAQEAHEAIRPTNPNKIELAVEPAEKRVYDLIWQRFMASQMAAARFQATTIDVEARGDKNYTLRARGSVMLFPGFLKVWPTKFSDTILPDVRDESPVKLEKVESEEHFTEPPARYNEASLVKALEEHGIGRPSTYSSIISVIQDRNYVEKNEAKRFVPTEIGGIVANLLTEHFPKIMDIGFTSDVEEELDEIALGVSKWQEVVSDFYGPFEKKLEQKYEEIKKQDVMPEEKTDKVCPECGKEMVIKMGRFGKFLACTGFPECKHTEKLEGELAKKAGGFQSQDTGIECPECHEGTLVSRRVSKGRARGKIFWGCSKYPNCKHAVWEKPEGIK